MYLTSTSKRFWTFNNEQDLIERRRRSIEDFKKVHSSPQTQSNFLNTYEESLLLRQYELQLKEFCKRFEPPMPKCTIATSYQYFKRFYLNNSIMNYHPKEILATCVYLASKVDEFNVSIQQFIANVKGDRKKAQEIILSNELLLMQELNYNLTVHNPFRAVEGFLIDIKTRCQILKNPDRLRKGIEDFLDKSFLTDACLIYAPSQIALAAVLHAASKEQENLDSYVTESLFAESTHMLKNLIEAVRKIRSMVKNIGEMPDKNEIRSIEKKLDKCRNQENNPLSQEYQLKMKQLLNEDDDAPAAMDYHMNTPDQSDISMINVSHEF